MKWLLYVELEATGASKVSLYYKSIKVEELGEKAMVLLAETIVR